MWLAEKLDWKRLNCWSEVILNMVGVEEIRVLLIAEQISAKMHCLNEMNVEARRSVHTASS
jgi:hypothetical protein